MKIFKLLLITLSITITTAEHDYSLSFDGVDDYVVSSKNDYDFTDGVSTHVFVKSNQVDMEHHKYILSQYSHQDIGPNNATFQLSIYQGYLNYHIRDNNGDNITGSVSVDGDGQDLLIADNEWHEIFFIYDGINNQVDISIDEYLFTFSVQELGDINAPTSIYLGFNDHNSDGSLNGKISRVSAWDKAIDKDNITDYDNSKILGYHFNEGVGNILTDHSGNVNDGLIDGATWSDDVPDMEEDLEWSIQILASQGDLTDVDNYLGASATATDLFDMDFDEVEPPSNPGSSLKASFPHPEWNHFLGNYFSHDIRSNQDLTDYMHAWDLEVVSTNNGEVTLDFSFDYLPEDTPVNLENVSLGGLTSLDHNDQYVFIAEANTVYNFTISVGEIIPFEIELLTSPKGPGVYLAETTHEVSWSVQGNDDLNSISIYTSYNGGETFELLESLQGQSTYQWTLPEVLEGVLYGVMIKVEAFDDDGIIIFDSHDRPFAIAGDNLFTTVPAGWNLWGSPVEPTESNLMDVNLDDDYEDSYFVAYHFANNGYRYSHYLYHNMGYWLGTTEQAQVDVVGTISQTDVTKELDEGWTLITNPILYPVSVDSLLFDNGLEILEYSGAVNAGWVNAVYSYDQQSYEPATTLKPWHAYWLGVMEEDLIVTFPFHVQVEDEQDNHRESSWSIHFQASIEGARDNLLTIGAHENATDLFDEAYDRFSPPIPPSQDQLSLTMSHPEWNMALEDKYKKDIRSFIADGSIKEWYIDVYSTSETVNVSWDFNGVPDEYEVGYSTNSGQVFSDMRNTDLITLSPDMELIIRVGTQVLGVDAPSVPQTFTLEQNYPNPFNPTTQIKYALPEDALVSISIYDVTGRMVKSLINMNQSTGYHSLRWDATNDIGEAVSAGMYIYTIQAGQYRATKKMVLLK